MIEIAAKFTGEVHTGHYIFDYRTTCDRCKKRRQCAVHWARIVVSAGGRVHHYDHDLGEFCRECGGKIINEIKEVGGT